MIKENIDSIQKNLLTDDRKILKALQKLASFAASTSEDGAKIPQLEDLVKKIVDDELGLPIASNQLSIIYQDYGEAEPRYIAIYGKVCSSNSAPKDIIYPCPANYHLVTDMIANTKSHDPLILDKGDLDNIHSDNPKLKLFENCQSVVLVPMRLTDNKHIGVFIVCDENGGQGLDELGDLLNIFSDLAAYFMRHNVRKRRNAALQRIQTDLMELGEKEDSLHGFEVINTFMASIKSWFNNVEAYLLMKHPLDTNRLVLAYDNKESYPDYRSREDTQLLNGMEKYYLGNQSEALENAPLTFNKADDFKGKGIEAACKSWAGAPLRLGKKAVMGFLVLHNRSAEYAFEDGEDEILDALSDFLALLLARLHQGRIDRSWRWVRDYYLEHPQEHDKRLNILYKSVADDLKNIHGVNKLVIMRYDHSELGLNSVYSSDKALDILLNEKGETNGTEFDKEQRFIRYIHDGDKKVKRIEKSFSSFRNAVLDIVTTSRKNEDNAKSAKNLIICDVDAQINYLISPMRTSTHSVGCFVFQSPNISNFIAQKIDDLSDALGKKVDNYNRWKRYQLLTDFGKKVATMVSPSEAEVIKLAEQFIEEAMYTKNLYIAFYDPDSKEIRFPLARNQGKQWKKEYGFKEDIEGAKRTLKKDLRGKTEEIIVYGEPLLHRTKSEATAWYSHPEHRDFAENPLASWVGVPIFSERGVMGVIAAYHDELDYIYSERDVFFLQQISFSVSGMLRALELEKLNGKVVDYEKQLQNSFNASDSAHRIKGSLSAIVNQVDNISGELVEEKELPDSLKELPDNLDDIRQTASDVLSSIEDSWKTEKEDIKVITILESEIKRLSVERKISEIVMKTDCVKVMTHQHYRSLQHVIHCLLVNACEASTQNSVIEVELRNDEENNIFYLSVKDNGRQIDDANVDNLFKLGFTTKKPISGEDRGYALWRSKIFAMENKGESAIPALPKNPL